MATYTPTPISKRTDVNKRVRVFDFVAAGTYTTGGDPITAVACGMRKIEEFNLHGGASDGTLQYPVTPVYSASGTSVNIKLFETGSAGAGSAEKGSGESLTSVTFRATVVGF